MTNIQILAKNLLKIISNDALLECSFLVLGIACNAFLAFLRCEVGHGLFIDIMLHIPLLNN